MAVSVRHGSIGATGITRHSHSGLDDLLGLVAGARPAWMADALCREYPRVDFYDESPAGVDRAAAICSRCLVRAECQAFALDNAEPGGVWGGLHPERLAAAVAVPRTSRPARPKWSAPKDWSGADTRVRRSGPCRACEREGFRISLRGFCGTCDRAWKAAGKPDGEEREAFVVAQRAVVAAA